jgi:hypothetical protein
LLPLSRALSFDLHPCWNTGSGPQARVARGYQLESTTFVFYSPTTRNRPFVGLDHGSGGAWIRTLGCSKNRWVDFDGEGGAGGGSPTRCEIWKPQRPFFAPVSPPFSFWVLRVISTAPKVGRNDPRPCDSARRTSDTTAGATVGRATAGHIPNARVPRHRGSYYR